MRTWTSAVALAFLLGCITLTALDKPVVDGSLAYHYHSSGHTVLPADWKIFFDFADRHYKAATKKQPDGGPPSRLPPPHPVS